MISLLCFAVLSVAAVNAQETCLRQVVSSFSVDGELRNQMQGEYGGANVTYTIADGELSVMPHTEEHAYWFVKFDRAECFNATNFQAISYDVRLPAGGNMMVTWTGHAEDCVTRTPDSTYVSILDYIHSTRDNWSKIVIPFTAVQNLSDGSGLFDFSRVKDYTFFFSPYNEEFIIDNIELIGTGCDLERLEPPSVMTSTMVPDRTTESSQSSSTGRVDKPTMVAGNDQQDSGSSMHAVGLLSVAVSMLAFM